MLQILIWHLSYTPSDRDFHLGSSFTAFREKGGVNLRILVSIVYLSSPRLDVLVGLGEIFHFVGKTPGLKRQITDRLCIRIEMLMKPIGRRHEQTSRTPVDTNARLPLFPEKRISFAG